MMEARRNFESFPRSSLPTKTVFYSHIQRESQSILKLTSNYYFAEKKPSRGFFFAFKQSKKTVIEQTQLLVLM